MTYSEKLRDPRWQKKRLKILNRDKWTCQYCTDKKTELHVHHLRYTGDPHQAPLEDLQTACKRCHLIITYIEKTFKDKVSFLYKVLFAKGYKLFIYTVMGESGNFYMLSYDFEYDKIRFKEEDTLELRKRMEENYPNILKSLRNR